MESTQFVPYPSPYSPVSKTECVEYKAGSVQLYTPQQSAVLKTQKTLTLSDSDSCDCALANRTVAKIATSTITENSAGPQYDRKETPSGVVWKLNKEVIISGVNLKEWPEQLTAEQMKERFDSGIARVLFTTPNNATHQQKRLTDVTTPAMQPGVFTEKTTATKFLPANLTLHLPESKLRTDWLDYFQAHPEQVVENGLHQAFGAEKGQYIKSRLEQFDPVDERTKGWKKICELLEANKTCGFPYTPSNNSPAQGKKENVILEMLLIQTGNHPSEEAANAMHIQTRDFLIKEGVKDDIGYRIRPLPRKVRGGYISQNQSVPDGAVQFFLTTTQVRQLFLALRSFVTQQNLMIEQSN